LFEYAWCGSGTFETADPLAILNNSLVLPEAQGPFSNINNNNRELTSEKVELYHYRHTKKTDSNKRPRDWKTRKDPCWMGLSSNTRPIINPAILERSKEGFYIGGDHSLIKKYGLEKLCARMKLE
jgi:hypothetical protein